MWVRRPLLDAQVLNRLAEFERLIARSPSNPPLLFDRKVLLERLMGGEVLARQVVDDILGKADAAVYEAKAQGRNRAVYAGARDPA